jgi:hypothetical protein
MMIIPTNLITFFIQNLFIKNVFAPTAYFISFRNAEPYNNFIAKKPICIYAKRHILQKIIKYIYAEWHIFSISPFSGENAGAYCDGGLPQASPKE